MRRCVGAGRPRNLRVLVNAGPGEEQLAEAIHDQSAKRRRGECTLAAADRADAADGAGIAGDTGPLHLACALAGRWWASTGRRTRARNGPFGTRFKVLRSPQSRRDHSRHEAPEAGLLTILAGGCAERAVDEVLLRRSAMSAQARANRRRAVSTRIGSPLAARSPGASACRWASSTAALYLFELCPACAASGGGGVEPGAGAARPMAARLRGRIREEESRTYHDRAVFAYTRNPLYLGSMLMAAGFAVALLSWPVALMLAVGFAAIYVPVIASEERFLRATFPGFDAYCRRVPRLDSPIDSAWANG
jgi:hypothetical protein